MAQILKLTETPIEITHLSAVFEPTPVYIEAFSTPLSWYQETRGTLLGHGDVNITIMEADTEEKLAGLIEAITGKALDMEELETHHRAQLRSRRKTRDDDDEISQDDTGTDEEHRITYYKNLRRSLGLRRRTRQEPQIAAESQHARATTREQPQASSAAQEQPPAVNQPEPEETMGIDALHQAGITAEENKQPDVDTKPASQLKQAEQETKPNEAQERRVAILELQIRQAVQHRQHRLCGYIRKCIQKDGKLRDACFAAGFKNDSGDIGRLWLIICKKYILPHPSLKHAIHTYCIHASDL